MAKKKILPSLLSAPFHCLGQAIRELEKQGVDTLHFDVMDGHFVPNITVGPLIIKSLAPHICSEFDVHLMVTNPEVQIPWFDHPRIRSLTFHIEATQNLEIELRLIRNQRMKAGISLKPSTKLENLYSFLESVDHILVMTVDPGFGGQDFMPEMLPKIEFLAEARERRGLEYTIQVDGGINENTIGIALDAGADEFVAGSAIFNQPNPIEAYLRLLGKIKM